MAEGKIAQQENEIVSITKDETTKYVQKEEEEKTYSEAEVIKMCIEEIRMTILQTSECKIYCYNRDTEEHAEIAFLQKTKPSDLANIEYLHIKNSCCIECSKELIKDIKVKPNCTLVNYMKTKPTMILKVQNKL